MTVAFFLTGPFPHLSETFILNQITGLLDRGHEVHVYAKRSTEPRVHAAVGQYHLLDRTTYWPAFPPNRIARAATGVGLLARSPARLLRTLDATRFGRTASSLNLLFWGAGLAPHRAADIVYCHFGWNGIYASMLREIGLLAGKLVTVFHGADLSWHLNVSGRDSYSSLFRTGDLFLPISQHWQHKLLTLGCPESRVVVHRMGIDCDRFAFAERRLDSDEPVRLITISRLVEKKGVEYGIRAVARLIERGRNVRYDIIGEGPLRPALEQLVRELGLGERVALLGARDQDEVLEMLRRSHVALAPSVTSRDDDQEGIPVSLMEAMAIGLPVVSTFHSGIPELVHDGVSGRLVPERDVDALASALESLVDHPDTWPAMGREGRRHVVENFNLRTLNDRLVEIFRGVVADRA